MVKGRQVRAWQGRGEREGDLKLLSKPGSGQERGGSLSDEAGALLPSRKPLGASGEGWKRGQPESPPQPLGGRDPDTPYAL